MIKLKTLLQEITVLPRRVFDMYQATLNQDITWTTVEGPLDLPADYAIYVLKADSNTYYLTTGILSDTPYREVYVIPAQYLSDITFVQSIHPQEMNKEALASIGTTLSKGKYIVGKPK